MVTAAMKLKDTCSLEEELWSRQFVIKKQRHYFANTGPYSESYGFSSSCVWIWELYHKGSWVPNNWCFWIVVLEKILESLLDFKEINPASPKGNQSLIFIERTDYKVEAEYFGHLLWRTDPFEKTLMLGKDRRQEDSETTENEMVAWHHRLMDEWASSWSWWRTRRLGLPQSMGSQRVGHNWLIELNWIYSHSVWHIKW